jgi:hypothetical protein
MSSKRLTKKEQFTRKETKKLPVILAVVLVAAFALYQFAGRPQPAAGGYFGEPVASPRSYIGRVVSMTPVNPVITGDEIGIPLSELEEKEIVYFEVANNEGTLVPLMAYITPSGRVFAGSSMCEPCRGRTFSLAGETLVCDTCRTTYTIEGHEFLAGSPVCGSYPPVNMQAALKGDMVVIPLAEVLKWRIRIL